MIRDNEIKSPVPQIGLLDAGTAYKNDGDHGEDHKCLSLPRGLFSLFDLQCGILGRLFCELPR